jgi:hypothetical protein
MSDVMWIVMLIAAIVFTGYLAIQLYISRRVIKTLQETAIVVTPPARKKGRAGAWLLQMILIGGIILTVFSLLLE